MTPLKPLRADARRNRDQLVATAREVFAELGTQAPLDVVARRAGIGNATLYRHFPTRDELLIAVYAEEVAELCAQADGDDVEALFSWLGAFVAHVAAKGDLARTLEPGLRRSELHEQWHLAMTEAVSRLVERAKTAGELRADVDPVDLLVLVSGIATAEAARVERLLRVVRRGVVES